MLTAHFVLAQYLCLTQIPLKTSKMDEATPQKSLNYDKATPLRRVRIAAHQTLEHVARSTGIDVGRLSLYERAMARPTAETAARLVGHFGPALIDEMRILYPERYEPEP